MATDLTNNEAAILDRLIVPAHGDLSAEAARSILSLEFHASDVRRMNELSSKAQEGLLTAEDEAELESYRTIGYLLELMRSKARLSLNGASASTSA
jgi:hypothetical protein